MNPDPVQIQAVMLSLIQKYVERQQIVFAAMTEMRPYFFLLASFGNKPTKEALEEYKRMADQFAHIPQGGHWGENKEWQYFFHGGGCSLVHTITGEPLNWDAPIIERFDKFWLLDYLQWLVGSASAGDDVTILRSALDSGNKNLQELTFATLDQLSHIGALSTSDSHNRYTLLTLAK